MKTSFFFVFFGFWKPPVFGRKKRFNFRAFREIPSQFGDKPCDSDSKTMKIRVKVVCTFLTLSKKPPPPPFSKSWLRACVSLQNRYRYFVSDYDQKQQEKTSFIDQLALFCFRAHKRFLGRSYSGATKGEEAKWTSAPLNKVT